MQSKTKSPPVNQIQLRTLAAIHSTYYDPFLKAYHLEVNWKGESNRENIFLPEEILFMAKPLKMSKDVSYLTVSINMEDCLSEQNDSKAGKQTSNGCKTVTPLSSLDELKKKMMPDLSKSLFKKEEEDDVN